MSSRVDVGLEFVSTHAKIYESTHAHYDGKTLTCNLFTEQNPSRIFAEVLFLSPREYWNIMSEKRYAKLTRVCGVEQILPTFTCIRETTIQRCIHINPRVYISHPHSTNYNDYSVLSWIQLTHHELLTVFTQKYSLFTQCGSGSCSLITQSCSELAAKGKANHS